MHKTSRAVPLSFVSDTIEGGVNRHLYRAGYGTKGELIRNKYCFPIKLIKLFKGIGQKLHKRSPVKVLTNANHQQSHIQQQCSNEILNT